MIKINVHSNSISFASFRRSFGRLHKMALTIGFVPMTEVRMKCASKMVKALNAMIAHPHTTKFNSKQRVKEISEEFLLLLFDYIFPWRILNLQYCNISDLIYIICCKIETPQLKNSEFARG